MKIWSDSFSDGASIPAEFAFGVPAAEGHVALSTNRNPHLGWADVPEATRSFAVLCVDHSAPTVGDDVNQEGREVPADLPRADFAHWILVGLSSDARAVEPASHSEGVTPGGKPGPSAPGGALHGLNDYTAWFAGDPEMSGEYFGYDGPCPPWNDALVHEYSFTVYALGVERLELPAGFGLAAVKEAMSGHVLAEARIVGTYSLNPALC